jgi:hypothetical protein
VYYFYSGFGAENYVSDVGRNMSGDENKSTMDRDESFRDSEVDPCDNLFKK